uniref:K Homology domain-containing protein n=1 Tax=Meloidogyne enterolobii TaxID=390850 RepID=A0A6V7W285_MELEN|nr:unnamed protein product [Meloidogyne enterolobii]
MSVVEKKTLDYTVDFPKLPDAPSATSTSSNVPSGAWTGSAQPAIKSSVVTEAFKLSAEERASHGGIGRPFGGPASEEQQKCNQIAQKTGTKIELNEAKDQSITILITGKQKNVEDARTRLVRELQTQATVRLEIPKEYHSFIIGKQGSKLHQLEQKFLCRIHMPNREEKSDVIRIVGPNEFIVEAAKQIKAIGDEMAKQKTENLNIPRSFYPWIRGVNNEKLDDLIHRTGVKINIPPIQANNETIIISGEREGVDAAVAEINHIYQEKKESVVSFEITVKKAQHRFIIGRKRTGLDEIFRETETIVEMPSEENDSNKIVLRGPKDKIGDAAGAVYQRASSIIAAEVPFQEWMRRHLIGPRGANLQNLVPHQENLRLDFEEGLIYIEGPPEEVLQAKQKLSKEITRLGNEFCSEVMHVAPSLHRHIIGKSGSVVNKLKEDFDVQIFVPNESLKSDLIRLEGKKENVEKVREQIADLVDKQQKRQQPPQTLNNNIQNNNTQNGVKSKMEQPTDVEVREQLEVDPKHHRHFIVRGAEVLREIQSQCGNCQISFPKQETGESTVIIRGFKENVENAKKRILAIVEDLEAYTTTQLDVDPKHHRHFILRGAEVLRDIQSNCGNIQISFPKQETGESTVVLRGHKDHVEAAKKRILAIVEELDSLVQEQLEVDPKHHRHFILRSAKVLRDIQNKCGNIQISFPKQETGESTVVLRGHKDHVEAAKKRILAIVEELDSLVQEELDIDPKHHRHFISRGAKVLREIQTACGNCQISFPKQDSGEALVILRGKKEHVEAAKEKIFAIIEELDFLSEFVLRSQQHTRREPSPPPSKQDNQNVEITGAPWQLDSLEQFPTIGNGPAPTSTVQKPVAPLGGQACWGKQR